MNKDFFKLSYNQKLNCIDVYNPFLNDLFDNHSHSIPIRLESESDYRTLRKGKHIYLCKFIPTQFLDNQELSVYWDKIILTPYGNEVIKSLQIIEPNIEKLAFISNPLN